MSRARVCLWGLAGAAAVVLGYLATTALIGASTPRHNVTGTHNGASGQRSPVIPVSVRGPGASRTDNPMAASLSDSRAGAVAAAANYLTVLSRTLAPRTRWSWAQAVRALTMPPLTARALSAAGASATIAHNLGRSRYYLGAWLLGYQVLAYTPATARVAVWNFGMMTSSVGVIPPDYATTTCTLRWVDGDWKVSDARVTPGPTPPAAQGVGATEALAFAASARRFVPFGDVP